MRIESIDVLRGIAILGILIMNISFHNNLLTGYVHFEQPLLMDEILIFLQSLFADGKFRTLLCLMFGAGMAIQYDWCQKHNANYTHFLKSRMHWLLIFGMFHITFIFGGDILVLYSICGLMVISRLPLEQDTLLKKGKKHFIVGTILILLVLAAMLLSDLDAPVIDRSAPDFVESVVEWRKGYTNQMIYQVSSLVFIFIASFLFLVWQPLGIMLIGVYLYRSGFFTSGFSDKTFRKLLVIAIFSSLLTASPAFQSSTIDPFYILFLSSVSAIFVALVYAHLIVKFYTNKHWLIDTLSACGKLAFTLYLSQSIVMALLFRAMMPLVAPDFDYTVTMMDFILISFAFIVIQMIFANW
ncbi:MAG: DUF418 domain-containing protein, partial [Pseudomonadota bacterium]